MRLAWFVAVVLGCGAGTAPRDSARSSATPNASAESLPDPASMAPGVIRGAVEDAATGERLAGVTVVAGSPTHGALETVISDQHGDFEIASAPAGDYTILVLHRGRVLAQRAVVVTSETVTTAHFLVDRAARPAPTGSGNVSGAACLADTECASGSCAGFGCTDDKPGACVGEAICLAADSEFLGCDGKMFRAPLNCPRRRVATMLTPLFQKKLSR